MGLSSAPEDARAWVKMVSLIPTPLAAAAVAVFALFAWARWGDQVWEWLVVARQRRAEGKASLAASAFKMLLYILIGAAVAPWVFFAAAYVLAFSNAVLFWVRTDTSFAEALARSLKIIQ